MPQNHQQTAKEREFWANRAVENASEIERLRETLLQIKLCALSYSTGFPVVNACEHLAKMAHDALNEKTDAKV